METLPDPQESVVVVVVVVEVAGNGNGGGVDGCSAARDAEDAGDGDKKEVERSEDIRVAADDVLGAASPCDSRIDSAQLFPSFLSCLYLLRCALAILAASIALRLCGKYVVKIIIILPDYHLAFIDLDN